MTVLSMDCRATVPSVCPMRSSQGQTKIATWTSSVGCSRITPSRTRYGRTRTCPARGGYTRESHAEMAPPYKARRVDSSWARAIAIQEMTVSEPMTL